MPNVNINGEDNSNCSASTCQAVSVPVQNLKKE